MNCSCDSCYLKDLLYTSIEDTAVEGFCNARYEKFIPAGIQFVEEGKEIKNFKYLKSGLTKIHRKLNNGNEQIISFARPKDFVSIQNVFSEKKYNYSVTALEDSVICIFPIDTINELILQDGNFAQKILQSTNHASNLILYNSLDLLSKSMYGKIATVLLFFQDKVYHSDSFELPVSRKEIAQYTGLSIETVIRVISEFRKDKIIKVYGKTIEVLNKQYLISVLDHS